MRSFWIYVCLLTIVALSAPVATADIFEWEWVDPGDHSLGRQESTTLVPDGAGLVAEPGVNFRNSDLGMAWLRDKDLNSMDAYNANFANADLAQANLTDANLWNATLAGVDFTGTEIREANLRGTVSRGFTSAQLYSSASYQTRDLSGISFRSNDLTGWYFGEQNLSSADFKNADLTSADLNQANLTNSDFYGVILTNADFTEAEIRGAGFDVISFELSAPISTSISDGRLTTFQLYSTASYHSSDLTGISLIGSDLTSWNFAGQNLTNANFGYTTLTDTVFTNAEIRGANFSATTASSFTEWQLYSTASYQEGDLTGTGLGDNDLSGWNFSDQNLTKVYLEGASLIGVNFSGAEILGANLSGTTVGGFTSSQMYSTASYQNRKLSGIRLNSNDLSSWNFSDQNLTEVSFRDSTLAGANFSGADIRGASFYATVEHGFTASQFYSTASYQAGDLTGISLDRNDLGGWNFSGQNLSDARLSYSNLTGVNFSGAVVRGVQFSASFTSSQLYSTASYHAGDLTGVSLRFGSKLGWIFAGQNLTEADFHSVNLTDVDFSQSNLSKAGLHFTNLNNTNFRGANLTETQFSWADMASTDLSGADTRGAVFGQNSPYSPISHNRIFSDGTVYGLDILPGETMRLWDYDPDTPLPIHVTDVMQIDATGALRVVIEDDAWGSMLTFESGIDVLLDGTLELLVSPDSDSTLATLVGTTFELFDWTGVSPLGTFAQITTMEGVLWDTSDLYTTGEVTLLELPGYLFGDFSEDGLVGGIDFLSWQSGFGTTSGATGAEGDADGDGDVDRADLAIWKQRYSTNIEVVPGDFNADGTINGIDFLQWQLGGGLLPWSEAELDDWERNFGSGSSPPVASFGFVPEPSTAGLALVMLLSFAARRTGRSRIV